MIQLSWKSVELQVALPRTQDAGKHQDQQSKQGQRFQESLMQSQIKQQEWQRKRINKFEQVRKKKVRGDDQNHDGIYECNDSEVGDHEENFELEHPFLGQKIDFMR